jgi:hypothetical protein
MTLKNKAKKEALMLKRKRAENIELVRKNLSSFLDSDCFEFMEPEQAQAVWIKIQSQELHCRNEALKDDVNTIDIKSDFAQKMESLSKEVSAMENEEVYVFPCNWQNSGALVIHLHSIFANLNGFLFTFDDDVFVYNGKIDNAICFIGDRYGDNLYTLEVLAHGSKWKDLIRIKRS